VSTPFRTLTPRLLRGLRKTDRVSAPTQTQSSEDWVHHAFCFACGAHWIGDLEDHECPPDHKDTSEPELSPLAQLFTDGMRKRYL
jgi:hypothetical protein